VSKALRKGAMILGAAALIATGVGAVGGLGIIAATTATSIGTFASLAAGVASLGAAVTAKPPIAAGSVTQTIIDPDAPIPYIMGGMYFGGVMRHRAGYGGVVSGITNPYLGEVVTYSGCGPVQSITPQVDFDTVPAWYSTYLYTDTQLGATPEASALTPNWSGMTGWGASSKLSGYAAILWNYQFDKAGKKFASGKPTTGAYVEGVKVYDPRLDSTFPGGSGACRLGNEATYVYSTSPALHAGTYAYGRFQNGIRVFGVGIPGDGIDWQVIADWANVCATNGWTIAGVIFEPGDRGANLIDICAAGGADPIFGASLSFKYHTPVVALDTITEADIADEDMSVVAMQGYVDRVNTVVPKYRSETHNWEMVAAEPVVNATTLTEDGEERRVEWPFNLVKDKDQAAELAAYRLMDSRELSPIELTVSPRFRSYRPGDCLELDLPSLGLATDAIILSREIDPATMKVRLVLRGETPAKHAYALGQTGVAPATPTIGQPAADRDDVTGVAISPLWGDIIATGAEPTGTTVAATITSAGIIATDAVETNSILDNAVSATGFAFTATGTLLTTTYANMQSLSVTADGVSPVIMQFALAYYWDNDNGKGECALYRDTTSLVALDAVTVNSGENPTMSGIFVDYPAAGTYTYYLKAKANNNSKIGAKNNALLNLELKK